MLGKFTYSNPTRLHFGKDSVQALHQELPKYGPNVLLVYGGGSIKRSGLYDRILTILNDAGKTVFEDPGVMPNPTVDKLYEGCQRARDHAVDLILAVGGGSVCDYAKAVSVSAHCPEDPWQRYYLRMEDVANPIIPDHGGHRAGDERRGRHHRSRFQTQDRSCFWRGGLPEIRHPRSGGDLYAAPGADDGGVL